MVDVRSFIMLMGALSFFFFALFIVLDLFNAIKAQFKNEQYKWHTIALIKEELDWKKGVLIVVWIAIVISAYWPFLGERKEDYRAERQKAEYSALYACYYDIPHYGDGIGYVLISHADGMYIIEKVYTNDGIILVNQDAERDDLEDDEFWVCFCGWHDSYFEVIDGPLSYSEVNFYDTRIAFGYPDPNAKYCYVCKNCGEAYHKKCKGSEGLCGDCD